GRPRDHYRDASAARARGSRPPRTGCPRMRISVGLVAGADPRRAAALEELPIDSLWVGGHVASPNPTPEAMTSLAMLTAVTERVRVGTSILLLPLYQPAVVAKQIADLDRMSGGRVILGVGVGG